MKYRKKPVVIEAMQLTRKVADVVCDFVGIENIEGFNTGEFAEDTCYIDIKTLEGVMTASEGDYIIKGVAGEFYPCRADIFERTYVERPEIPEDSLVFVDCGNDIKDRLKHNYCKSSHEFYETLVCHQCGHMEDIKV